MPALLPVPRPAQGGEAGPDLLAASPVPAALLDAAGRVARANPALGRFLGRPAGDLLGACLRDVVDPRDADRLARLPPHERRARGGDPGPPAELRFVRPDGRTVWGRVHVAALGEGVLVQVEDVDERTSRETLLAEQATTDALTGLPNRRRTVEQLREALATGSRTGLGTVVLFCDLDRLKLVNDAHGHAAGDAYIREVSARLRSGLRADDVVGRLSGDEFVVVLRDVATAAEALELAERVVQRVRQPLEVAGAAFLPSVSVGIASSRGRDLTADALLAEADSAMYVAKVQDRGSWHVHDDTAPSSAADALALHGQVRRALEAGELVLHYQPVVDLETGEAVAHEALLRWQHPERGLLLPADFLHVVLGTEHEGPVTAWVLDRACRDAAARLPARVCVNVSSLQVCRPDLPAVVQRALAAAGLAPQRLVLELTEERLLAGTAGEQALRRLRVLGVHLAVDDFGTGYAALDYLQRFSTVDVLKLDATFARALGQDPASEHIVRAMVGLARGCGLLLVAEGVEREDQRELLRQLGARYAQGHLLGPPVPLGD